LRRRIRAAGITAYLENGGTLEHAQQTCPPKPLAAGGSPHTSQSTVAHGVGGSPRTTKLYDRTSDQVSLDEIERIVI